MYNIICSIGRKMWIFISPSDMEKYDPVCTPSTLLLKGSEQEFFQYKVDNIIFTNTYVIFLMC